MNARDSMDVYCFCVEYHFGTSIRYHDKMIRICGIINLCIYTYIPKVSSFQTKAIQIELPTKMIYFTVDEDNHFAM